MGGLVSEDINRYCAEHSTTPSALCDELEAYTRANVAHANMVSGAQVASLLGFLIRMNGVKRILEVGTFTGYSALAMAENLPDGGELITLDVDPETNKLAKSYWAKSPHGRKIQSFVKPALETIRELKGEFDLVFIDADKTNYLNYLKAVLPKLSSKGIVVADNTLWSGKVLDRSDQSEQTNAIRAFNDFVRESPELQSTLLPVRDGLHLVRRQP